MSDGCKVDSWREADDKSTSGCRGLAETLRLYREQGKAVIIWEGFPMLVPLRHIHPHVGFVWMLTSQYGPNSERVVSSTTLATGSMDDSQRLVAAVMQLV